MRFNSSLPQEFGVARMATTGFQPAGASEDEDDASCSVPLPIREAVLRDILMSGFVTDAKMGPAALSLSSVLVRAFVECATHHPCRSELVSRRLTCPIGIGAQGGVASSCRRREA